MSELTAEQVVQQLQLLTTHRRTLQIYLQQQAEIGKAYSPPSLVNGIYDTRGNIQRIKAVLRAANVVVADEPDDDERVVITRQTLRQPVEPRLKGRRFITGALLTAAIATLAVILSQSFLNPRLPKDDQSNSSATLLSTTTAEAAYTPLPTYLPLAATTIPINSTRIAISPQDTAFPTEVPPYFGPVSGALPHNIGNDDMEVYKSGISLQNFTAEVRFYNPYNRTDKLWNYGFIFRTNPQKQEFRIYLDSGSNWFLQHVTQNNGTSVVKVLQRGSLSNIDVESNGSNVIRLVVNGKNGQVFVNNTFIVDIDISAYMDAGDVYLATGLAVNDEMQDHATRYENFEIWSIQ